MPVIRILFILTFLSLGSHFSWGETRLGNYYFGFGIHRIEHSRSYWENNGSNWTPSERKMDGYSFELSLNLPLSDSFDLNLGIIRNDFNDDAVTDHLNQAHANLIYRFNRFKRETGFALPFAGLGLQYSEYKIGNWNPDARVNSALISNKEKLHIKIQTGAELYLNPELTLTPRLSYINQLFLDAQNDFLFDVSLSWLATRRHALSLAYSKYIDSQHSSLGIEYLHSWK